MLPPSTRRRRCPEPSTALTSPCAETILALACTALGRAAATTRADSAPQSRAHTRASKSVPRMPMVAVFVCTLAALGELLAISPVTARKPPRTSCMTMLLSGAFALKWYCCKTSSELGRTVMRVPSSSLMMAEAPSEVVSRSPSFRARPLPSVRGVWPGVWAKPTPRANSTSPADCAPAPAAAANSHNPRMARARGNLLMLGATMAEKTPETILSSEYLCSSVVIHGCARVTQREDFTMSTPNTLSCRTRDAGICTAGASTRSAGMDPGSSPG